MIDSCIHFEKNNIDYIRKISKNLQSKGITCALSIFDNENTLPKREQFRENCKKFKNLLPVALIRNTKDLNSEFKLLLPVNSLIDPTLEAIIGTPTEKASIADIDKFSMLRDGRIR